MPDFWQKVTILYSGGDDFAVCGDWDALLPLARELQRVFHRFADENLKELPGPEGKTITMAVALAQSSESTLASCSRKRGSSSIWPRVRTKTAFTPWAAFSNGSSCPMRRN